jgi:hypothetical protein
MGTMARRVKFDFYQVASSQTLAVFAGPQAEYFYIAGHVVRVHAACDALWKQERT